MIAKLPWGYIIWTFLIQSVHVKTLIILESCMRNQVTLLHCMHVCMLPSPTAYATPHTSSENLCRTPLISRAYATPHKYQQLMPCPTQVVRTNATPHKFHEYLNNNLYCMTLCFTLYFKRLESSISLYPFVFKLQTHNTLQHYAVKHQRKEFASFGCKSKKMPSPRPTSHVPAHNQQHSQTLKSQS